MKKLLQQLTILLALLAAATINAGAQVTEDRMLEFQIDANGDGAFNANGEMIDLTGQYTWESSTNTLTLNGVTWETTADTAFTVTGLGANDTLTIYLERENNFTSLSNDSTAISAGMYMPHPLIITGDGTLNLKSGATRNSLALLQEGGDLIINSGTVNSTGSTTAGIESYGIYIFGAITINGGTVTAIGGDAGEDSAGIVSDSLTINDGVLSAKGGEADILSYGISTLKINIAGGEVEATGSGNAINAEEEFNLDNPYVYWISTSTTAPGGDGNKDQGFYNSDTYKYVKIVMPIYRVTTLNHVRADMEYALPDETVTYTVDIPSDSVLVRVFVNGEFSGNLFSFDTESGEFAMPTDSVTISAVFEALQDTYQVIIGFNVTSSLEYAYEGDTVTYTVDTPPGLVLDSVIVFGTPSGKVILTSNKESGSFVMPAEDVTISTVFTALRDTYQVETGDYVTSPFSSASEGDTVTYTVDTPPGFVLDSVSVIGVSGNIIFTSDKESGSFVMPAEDVTIMAVFQTPIDPDPAPDPVANIRLELTDELTVRIHSIGELPTGELTLMLEGDEAKYFTLPEKTVESIASGDFSDIMLAPADCMGTGCYRVTLIVKGEGVESFIHIFYSHTKGPVAVEDIEGASVLRSWVENGQLRITGLTPGEHWQVYSLTGSLVHTAIADNDVARLPLPARGVYIVSASGTVLKVLY